MLRPRLELGLGGFDKTRITDHVNRCRGHDFRGMNQTFMRGCRLSLSRDLPRMARGSDRVGGNTRLCCWNHPAHIPDIGRSDHCFPSMAKRDDEIAKSLAGLRFYSATSVVTGDVVFAQRRLYSGSEVAVGVIEGDRAEPLQIGLHGFVERRVGQQIGDGAEDPELDLRFGHHRRPSQVGETITLTDSVDGGVGIAFRKGDEELRTRVNEALAEIMEDGTYDKMAAAYFDFDITPPHARD